MTPEVQAALTFVAEFDGDPRCSLNCHYSEILAAEVRRLDAIITDTPTCPKCKGGHNSLNEGGTWACPHCACGYIECADVNEGSCDTCKHRQERYMRPNAPDCGRTAMNDGVHITVTTVPCSFLGNGCRAWEGR